MLPRRVGPILIALGVAIFLYQAVALLGDRAQRTSRTRVLTGSGEDVAGSVEVRPLLSVVGVAFVAGGIFSLALGGKR